MPGPVNKVWKGSLVGASRLWWIGFVWKASFEPGWNSDYVMDGDGDFDGDCVHSKIDGTLEVLERRPQSE